MEIDKGQFHFKRFFVIAAVFFVIYNLNLIPTRNSDSTAAALLPFSIVRNHSLYLDEFYTNYARNESDKVGEGPLFFLRKYKDHYISYYPITLPLIISPFYIPIVYALHLQNAPPEKIIPIAYACEKLFASIIAALSVAVFFTLLCTLFGFNGLTWLLTVAYAIGTGIWPQASQLLYQHGFSCLMVILAILFFLRSNTNKRYLFFVGIVSALAITERYNNVFVIVLLGLIVVVRNYKNFRALVLYFTGPLIIAGLFFWYNLHFFNNLSGGYATIFAPLSGKIFIAIAGMLVSPSRGLFIFSPFLFAAVIGIVIYFRKKEYRNNPLYAVFLIAVISNLFLLATIAFPTSWWGGFCYGPRQLTEITPLLILFIPLAKNLFERFLILKWIFIFSIGLSIIINGIGVFCYPKGAWNTLPNTVDVAQWKLWDFKNNQIMTEAQAGLNLHMVKQMIHKIKDKTTIAQHALPDSAMRADIRITPAVPVTMIAGYYNKFSFTIVNSSTVFWPAGGLPDGSFRIFFSYYWKRQNKEIKIDKANLLHWDIIPGKSWSDEILVNAPTKPGIYTLGFDLYQSGNGWFHEKGSTPKEYNVTLVETDKSDKYFIKNSCQE